MPFKAVFHAGELKAQQLAGTRGVAEELSTAISNTLPTGGRLGTLFSNLRLVSIASVSPSVVGQKRYVWVSILFGNHFVTAPSPSQLRIDLSGLAPQDILRDNILDNPDSPVGFLALDFLKRRRYRTNGIVHEWPSSQHSHQPGSSALLDISVREAFPNCPKYIQIRDVTPETAALPPITIGAVVELDCALSKADQALISASDTMFLGTFHEVSGADVNHRGGHPGFVRVVSENEIYWPDYRGNGLFQSFGNLQVNKRAGLTFVDFSTGQVLQLSGSAAVEWEVDKDLNIEASAERVVRFCVDAVRRSIGSSTNYRWKTPEYSPYNPIVLGSNKRDQTESIGFPMDVTLVKIVEESPVVKTFRFLAPRYIDFLPGQYATFGFGDIPQLGKGRSEIVRTWTLSESANSIKGDVTLEVTVKRKAGGLMSNWLHDYATEGLRVQLLGIGGDMTPFASATLPPKMLLISGGIGITPNMAILRGIGARSEGQDKTQPDIVFIHQERNQVDIPFKSELYRRAKHVSGKNKLITLISGQVNVRGEGSDGKLDEASHVSTLSGRMSVGVLRKFVPELQERKIFLCGPVAFMSHVTEYLVSLGVTEDSIVTEHFNF